MHFCKKIATFRTISGQTALIVNAIHVKQPLLSLGARSYVYCLKSIPFAYPNRIKTGVIP